MRGGGEASQSGEVVLFPFVKGCAWGGGHFISLNHNCPVSPPRTTTTHDSANRRGRGKDASGHRPSKTKRPATPRWWVQGTRLAPPEHRSHPPARGLSAHRRAKAASSLRPWTDPVLRKAPGEVGREKIGAGARCPSTGRTTQAPG